jgi:carbonic anhydrase
LRTNRCSRFPLQLNEPVISYKLLGTSEWFVIHHTDCGMELFTNDIMPVLLEKSLETAKLTDDGWIDVGSEPGSSAGREIDWLTFENARASVVDDVRHLREHPLVPKRIPIYGYIYNVRTGRLEEVKEAAAVGARSA